MEAEESLIQLKNYRPHPTNERYMVFIYHDERMAQKFEEGLNKAGVSYEADITENGPNKRWLIGVHRRDMNQARECNNLAVGAYRKPFIPDPILRYGLIILSVGIILLAIIGFIKSK